MTMQLSTTPAKGVFINNRWQPAASGKEVPVVAPAEGRVFTAIAAGGAEDIDLAARAARAAADGGAWSQMSATERGRILSRMAQAVADHADELALLEARDTGKRMRQARNDMVATAWYFEYYGGAADKVHGVYINSFGAGGGIELPFGGMKKSGHGREKGFAALHDMSQIRTTIFKHG